MESRIVHKYAEFALRVDVCIFITTDLQGLTFTNQSLTGRMLQITALTLGLAQTRH